MRKKNDQFYEVTRKRKNKATGEIEKFKARHTQCADCHKSRAKQHYSENSETYNERNAVWRSDPQNKKRQQATARRNTYNLTPTEFKKMRAAQGNACKICVTPFKRYAKVYVDHCHACTFVRHLLCNSCNVTLGKYADDPEALEDRGYQYHAAYVREHLMDCTYEMQQIKNQIEGVESEVAEGRS